MQISEIGTRIQEHTVGMNVLYVEDDDAVRLATLDVLHSIFPSVTTAKDGAEGLEIFQNGLFDIVISDIVMPKMNGIEMVKKIKELNETQNIIIISGNNDSDFLLDLIHLGISRFIVKPIKTKDMLTSILEVTTNISNAKQAVKLIEQEKVMQRQTRLAQMGEMVGMIAHQWRQPLNALGLITQKIQMLSHKGALSVEYIDANVEQSMELITSMSKTIDDFMDIARDVTEKHIFDFKSIIVKVESILSGRLESKGIELIYDMDKPLEINSNKNEFFHVLLNLISNASDAFADQDIDDKRIFITVMKDQNSFSCVVKDTAGGIPEDVIDKVFNPYFTTKDQGKGTGLGLDISRRIIEKVLNGTLDVHNDVDGAVFTIKIKL